MKRRSRQSKKLRDRRTSQSPYRKYSKREYKYATSSKPREATPAPT